MPLHLLLDDITPSSRRSLNSAVLKIQSTNTEKKLSQPYRFFSTLFCSTGRQETQTLTCGGGENCYNDIAGGKKMGM